MAKNLNKDIEFRMRAVKNMFITIGTIAVVVTYTALYSTILMIYADNHCSVVEDVWVSSF